MSELTRQYAQALNANFNKIDSDRSGSFSEDELAKFTADQSQDKLAREAADLLKSRFFEATLLADSRVEQLTKESFTNSPMPFDIEHDAWILPGVTNPYTRSFYRKTFGEDESLPRGEITRRDIEVLDQVTQPKNYYERQSQFRRWELAAGIASGVVGYPITAAIGVTGTVATLGVAGGSGPAAPISAAILGTITYAGTRIVGEATYRRTRAVVNSEADGIGAQWQWRQEMVENWINDRNGFRRVR